MEWDYRERVKGGSMGERKKRKDMRAREGERGRESEKVRLYQSQIRLFCVCAKRNKEFTKTKNEHSDVGTSTGNRGHQIAEKQQEGGSNPAPKRQSY